MAAGVRELLVDGRRSGLRVRLADRWHERALGLLATRSLDDPAGLWIVPCRGVHMFGMRYAIDVAFLDREGRVLKTICGLRPWRAAGCRGARAVLELRSGLLEQLELSPGLRLGLLEPLR